MKIIIVYILIFLFIVSIITLPLSLLYLLWTECILGAKVFFTALIMLIISIVSIKLMDTGLE